MPFEPSGVGAEGCIPATCWHCGLRPTGTGIGKVNKYNHDYKWLCEECIPILDKIKDMTGKRLEILELEALQGGVEAVGDYLDKIGIYDLAQMDELDARMIVKAAWQGSAKRLRELVKETN